MRTALKAKQIFNFQGSVVQQCKDRWQMWEVGHSKEKTIDVAVFPLLPVLHLLDFLHKWPKPLVVICISAHLDEIYTGQWLWFRSLF